MNIGDLQKSIDNNRKYLTDLYSIIDSYKRELTILYNRNFYYDLDFSEECNNKIEINELSIKYNNFKDYVKDIEKKQRERKILLKNLQKYANQN